MLGERLLAGALEDRWRQKTSSLHQDNDIVPPSRTWEELSGKTTEELQI